VLLVNAFTKDTVWPMQHTMTHNRSTQHVQEAQMKMWVHSFIHLRTQHSHKHNI